MSLYCCIITPEKQQLSFTYHFQESEVAMQGMVFGMIVCGVGLLILALFARSLCVASATREAVWQKTQEGKSNPSTEEVLAHVPELLRERLLENGFSEEEILEKVEGAVFFLREIFFTGVNAWEKYGARALADKMFALHEEGAFDAFNVLRFDVEYMCHDPEDDTYFLSDELALAINRRKEQPLSLRMLPFAPAEESGAKPC